VRGFVGGVIGASPCGKSGTTNNGVQKGKVVSMRIRPLLLKVHRWLTFMTAVPLGLAALTGAFLTFETQIDRALNRDYWNVRPQTQRLPWEAVVKAAEMTHPRDLATSLQLPAADDVAAEVSLKNGWQVSVDPYSGRVLGARRREQVLVVAVHQFHTKLLLGEWGSRIMGVNALALVILSLTGLVLWWRHKAFRIRWAGSWRRTSRDLHYGLGIVGLLVWLLLGLTGAAITFESIVRPALFYLTGSEPNVLPVVQSTALAGTPQLTVDDALAVAARTLPGAETMLISIPNTPGGTFKAFMKFPEDHTPAGRSRVILDQYSGRALWVENSRTAALATRIWIKNRPLHTGDIFGWPTRMLACAACLILLVQLVTGFVMWWRRHKKNEGG
jgi:uncharacterized iron-regulated membrane protein